MPSSRTRNPLPLTALALSLLLGGTAWAADAAGEAYLGYHKLVVGAKSLSDLDPLLCRKNRETDASLPADKQAKILSLMQGNIPADVEYLRTTTRDASHADVFVTSKGGKKLYGRVEMVLEDGEWKVVKEHWKSHP